MGLYPNLDLIEDTNSGRSGSELMAEEDKKASGGKKEGSVLELSAASRASDFLTINDEVLLEIDQRAQQFLQGPSLGNVFINSPPGARDQSPTNYARRMNRAHRREFERMPSIDTRRRPQATAAAKAEPKVPGRPIAAPKSPRKAIAAATARASAALAAPARAQAPAPKAMAASGAAAAAAPAASHDKRSGKILESPSKRRRTENVAEASAAAPAASKPWSKPIFSLRSKMGGLASINTGERATITDKTTAGAKSSVLSRKPSKSSMPSMPGKQGPAKSGKLPGKLAQGKPVAIAKPPVRAPGITAAQPANTKRSISGTAPGQAPNAAPRLRASQSVAHFRQGNVPSYARPTESTLRRSKSTCGLTDGSAEITNRAVRPSAKTRLAALPPAPNALRRG